MGCSGHYEVILFVAEFAAGKRNAVVYQLIKDSVLNADGDTKGVEGRCED